MKKKRELNKQWMSLDVNQHILLTPQLLEGGVGLFWLFEGQHHSQLGVAHGRVSQIQKDLKQLLALC